MQDAIRASTSALGNQEVPVGAVIVYKNSVIASAYNKMRKDCDPTAHAEILVIQDACRALSTQRLTECDLYVTLEPCPMCAAAISFARIRRLYYGASDVKSGGIQLFNQKNCHHVPEIYDGLCERDINLMLKDFFKQIRILNRHDL
jgi:tRNA(Arg) A34 adenosine deaminase TadA